MITGTPSDPGKGQASSAAGMRPEDELILACCRAALGTDSPRIIQDLGTGGLDWEHVLSTASRHSVIPLVYQAFKAVSFKGVPLEAQKRLQDQFQENTQWSLYLTSEVVSILTLLASQAIKAVPFKGPVLSELLYGSVARRQFVDLDIFVRREDFSRIKELLISQGYRPDLLLSDAQEALLLRTYYHQGFYHETKGVLVELHWEIMRFFLALPPYAEALWERLEPRSLLGTEILCFSPEDLLLVLCLHAAPHSWSRLGWVCDVAAAISQPGRIHWEKLLETAGQTGTRRMLLLGLALAQDLLAAPLPPIVGQRVQADGALKKLMQGVHERLFPLPGYEPNIIQDTLFHIKLRETLREKIRQGLHTLFSPAFDDFLLYALPPSLSPLYYLLRPVRLLRTYFLKRSTPA